MNSILMVGILIFTGYIIGEAVARINLPRVTGYILAGIFLNPRVSGIISSEFLETTELITNILLALITFSVGGTLAYSKIKELGKSILTISLFEAELSFLLVTGTVYFSGNLFSEMDPLALLALSLLIGALASPTDPAATLAVMHEYDAEGPVSRTIMGVAATDDALGIINFSIATAVAVALFNDHSFSISFVSKPAGVIAGSIAVGITCGFIYMFVARSVRKKAEDEAVLIAVLISLLSVSFGISEALDFDSLLSTMVVGITVVNFSSTADELFNMIDRYLEELVFILFFTISGMHLDFAVLATSMTIVAAFVTARAVGKYLGVYSASTIFKAPQSVKRNTAGGLIPQGGIVIGLALVTKQHPSLSPVSDILISAIIGGTVIHEVIGPILSRAALSRAGELNKK